MTASASASTSLGPGRPPVNKWLVTLSVTFGTLMGAIDSSIVNVAVPHIRGSLGCTVEEITWVSTGFAIATVLVMPLTAFLGRLFGQKRVYMACLGIFLGGSALCGLAWSLPSLVIFRAIQGFGAGALQPTEQAILRQTFPPHEQGMAMALFGLAVMIGPAVGPTLGGYIVDHTTWPWIFYINLPVGALGLFMVSRFVHEPEDIQKANLAAAFEQRKNMDWAGIALLSVGLFLMQYVLEEGNKKDWFDSRIITAFTLLGAFVIAAFIIRELTAKVPAVNLRLFKDPVFLSGTAVGAIMFAMLMANMFLLPLFMQELLGFTATQSGLALMPRVLVMAIATPLVGRLYNVLPPQVLISAGILSFVVGAYEMSHFTLQTGPAQVVFGVAIQGIGLSALFITLTTVALSQVPRHLMTDATGLNSLLRQTGGSIGLAVFATLLSRYATTAKSGIVAHLYEGNPAVMSRLLSMQKGLMAQGADPVAAKTGALHMLSGIANRQAMVLSFEKLFLLAGLLFIAILPLLFFLKTDQKARGGKVHVEIE